MNKKFLMILPACAVLGVAALAAGGAEDPLASLSYLTGRYTAEVEARVDQRLEESDQALLAAAEGGVLEVPAADAWTEKRMKQGDILQGETGTSVLLLAGAGQVTYSTGAVVDVTTGKEVPSGSALERDHRYLAAENTSAMFIITSKTAVLHHSTGAVVDVTTGKEVPSGSALERDHRYLAAENTSAMFIITSKTAVLHHQGPGGLILADTVDYNAMAGALKQLNLFQGTFTGYGQGYDLELLNLFQGTFTGYGQGYDLELAPTRLQALIMFIRVLGEEEAALAWTGATPFTDISKGSRAEKYVGYAYERGYTNGFSATQFKPGSAVNAYQYTEFILRAMGYSSSANTNLADTLSRARVAGVLTDGETAALQTGKFLRADLVYISYYALESVMPDGVQTLGQTLVGKGVFTETDWAAARSLVTSRRM